MAVSQAIFLAIIAAIAVQRLAELVRSRAHIAALGRAGHMPVREPAFIAMTLVHTLVLVLSPLEVFAFDRPFVPAIGVPAFALVVAAQFGRSWVFRTLQSAWNVRVVRPRAIVTGGPYRYVRHPNYLIVCVELLCLPMIHFAWWTALAVTVANALVLRSRIALEESVLAENPEWLASFRTIPRLIPLGRRAG